jgi:hypothetical protein
MSAERNLCPATGEMCLARQDRAKWQDLFMRIESQAQDEMRSPFFIAESVLSKILPRVVNIADNPLVKTREIASRLNEQLDDVLDTNCAGPDDCVAEKGLEEIGIKSKKVNTSTELE